jgi:glycosyltransferase involved in cell wall biosynthesis
MRCLSGRNCASAISAADQEGAGVRQEKSVSAESQAARVVNVLVTVPAGTSGQGGIDRLMASLKQALAQRPRPDVNARFRTTRGMGHIAFSPFHVAAFCLDMLSSRLSGSVDVVHINLASHGSTYRKLMIAAWARILGIPYVLHLHSGEYRTFWPENGGFLDRRIRTMFGKASRIIVLGRVWKEFVLARVPEAGDRVVVVPNAAEAPSRPHRGGGDAAHIIFLGRIGEKKGTPELCEALSAMAGLPGWRATIAGDGNAEELRRRVEQLGLSDRIKVPGWLGPADTADLLSEADILVLPSHVENLPMSVIEGMAAGLAVVSTRVGAVEDIVSDGETGFLVWPRDVPALRHALTRLVEEPDLRRRMGEAGRAVHRARLDLQPFADTVCEVWRTAAGRRMGSDEA